MWNFVFKIILPGFFGGTIDCTCNERDDDWECSKGPILDAIAANIEWSSVFIIDVDIGCFT